MSVSMIAASVATVVVVPLVFWLIWWDVTTISARQARRAFVLTWREERAIADRVEALSARADAIVASRPVPERLLSAVR